MWDVNDNVVGEKKVIEEREGEKGGGECLSVSVEKNILMKNKKK